MTQQQQTGTEHRCKRCQGTTESVSLNGGGRIGWFCWKCDLFHPGEGVKTWPLRTGREQDEARHRNPPEYYGVEAAPGMEGDQDEV